MKNTGLFEAFKKENNMKAVFVGHDHNNSYSGFYRDIELVFGRKGGYGSDGPNYVQKGATVIKVKEHIDEFGNTDFTYKQYII